MKKIVSLLTFSCLSFAATAQWYTETTKFEKYRPQKGEAYNVQYRYDPVKRMNLNFCYAIDDTIDVIVTDYDAAGNAIQIASLCFGRDKKNSYRYR